MTMHVLNSTALSAAEYRLNGMSPAALADANTLAALLEELDYEAVLREIACDPALLARSAARSYTHANGFTKIVLARGACWALRLHIHAEGDRPAAYHVHDHRWPFASTVLRGTFMEDRFEVMSGLMNGPRGGSAGTRPEGPAEGGCGVREGPDEGAWKAHEAPQGRDRGAVRSDVGRGDTERSEGVWQHYTYRSDAGDDGAGTPLFGAQRVGEAHLRHVARIAHPAGSTYALPLRVLHALPGGGAEGGCATLVLTGTPAAPTCNLFSLPEEGRTPGELTAKQPLAPAALRALLLAEGGLR
jgi:hypothetical protein